MVFQVTTVVLELLLITLLSIHVFELEITNLIASAILQISCITGYWISIQHLSQLLGRMLRFIYRAEKKGWYVVERYFFLAHLFLPGPAWLYLSKICKPFFSSLYKRANFHHLTR